MRAVLASIWQALKDGLHRFFQHPLQSIWDAVKYIASAMWYGTVAIVSFVARVLGLVPGRVWIRGGIVAGVLAVILVGGFIVLMIHFDNAIAPAEMPDRIHYIGQGWGVSPSAEDRETYYHTPQGSYVRNLRYDWMQHLERPWSTRRFADPEYMRAYGFMTDDAQLTNNHGQLPVGFAARYDADLGEMMLDVTCAVCHSGELMYVQKGVRTAVRIDGGSANQDFFTAKPGYFAGDLFASLISTYFNPFKWARFRNNVLKDHDNSESGDLLRTHFGQVLWTALSQGIREARLGVYPVEEGYGRTDGLGRILNNAFAVNLSESNYRVANAPVSYPPVWNMWKFDWVQYMGSVRQPMARNIGEAMGTGAKYWLHDPYGRPVPAGERYNASTLVANLNKIEETLQRLQPPCWPEDVFGKVNKCLAMQGYSLFQKYCFGCHGVNQAKEYVTRRDAPGKIAAGAPHWIMTTIPIQEIGTDPQSALNFVRYRLDLTPTGLKAPEVRAALEPYYKENYARLLAYYPEVIKDPTVNAAGRADAQAQLDHLNQIKEDGYIREQLGSINLSSVQLGAGLNYLIKLIRDQAYDDMGIKKEQYAQWDGFGQLDIPQVSPVYKARPLSGIWSTPAFLHNGSVPSIYHLLVAVYQRPKKFYRKSQTYDPVHLGVQVDQQEKNAMLFDTTVTGNSNAGHEFRAGYRPRTPDAPVQYGLIGPELSESERYAIIEYLKVHRDDLNAQTCPAQIPQPPAESDIRAACTSAPAPAVTPPAPATPKVRPAQTTGASR